MSASQRSDGYGVGSSRELSYASAISRKRATSAPHSRRELSQPSQPQARRTIDRHSTCGHRGDTAADSAPATDFSAAARLSHLHCRCLHFAPSQDTEPSPLPRRGRARSLPAHAPSFASCANSSLLTWKRQAQPICMGMPTRCSFVKAWTIAFCTHNSATHISQL